MSQDNDELNELITACGVLALIMIVVLVFSWNFHLENDRIRQDADATLQAVVWKSLESEYNSGCRIVKLSGTEDTYTIYYGARLAYRKQRQ